MKRTAGFFGILLISLLLVVSSAAHAGKHRFTKVFAFGDSLSDIGNVFVLSGETVPPPTRYFSGRFSNGPVWVETLADAVADADLVASEVAASGPNDPGLQGAGRSYAYAAAGTGELNLAPSSDLFPAFPVVGLLGQVASFAEQLGQADPGALYVVWSGANDYLLAGAAEGIPSPPDPENYTVPNILAAVQKLHDLGARRILALNLPDLGTTPIAVALERQFPGTQQALSDLTTFHNQLLREGLSELQETRDRIRVYYFDVYSLFKVISIYPGAFGFSNGFTDLGPAANCLIQLLPEPQSCAPIDIDDPYEAGGSVFWDEQHPTTQLHNYVAAAATFCLKVPGLCKP